MVRAPRASKEIDIMKIGFVGLGPMGAAMARRLVAAEHAVTVWNRTTEKTRPLVEAGAKSAGSPAEAARGADLVLSSVANDAALGHVTEGADGIAAGLAAGATHVSLSTVSLALIRRLAGLHAAQGQSLVSAPVLGRPPAAEAGKLFTMVAGPAEAIGRAAPALHAFSQRIFAMGDRPEQANLAKLACNFLIFSTIEQFAEVFAIAEKGGLDRAAIFELLTESFFSAPVHKNYGKLILDRAYEPGVPVTLGAKDTRLFLEAGEELGTPLPMASLLRDRFLSAIAQGLQSKDFTIIAQLAAASAGIEKHQE
jgi:3-hydroxyisobutyrate dehydrogenase-like beta-hydroxyacid dehydrogenase